MTDAIINIDCGDGSRPNGIEIEGINLSKGSAGKNQLFIGNSFEVPNTNDNLVEKCRDSNPSSLLSNNQENTTGIGETLPIVPFVGMEFDTIEASHKFWKIYSRDSGFVSRIRSTSKKSDGVIRTRTYVCSKEGKRFEIPSNGNSKSRPETRCGCGVLMTVSLIKKKGIYRVVSFIGDHNHGLDINITNAPRVEYQYSLISSTNLQNVNKPFVGMEFDTLDASREFWEKYACNVGFIPRIRGTSKNKSNGVVRTRTYVCSKEGKKFENTQNINSKRRLETRCGCGVLMTVSLVKAKETYRVVTFFKEHNHELDSIQDTPRVKRPGKGADKSHNMRKIQDIGIKNNLYGENEVQESETLVPEGSLDKFMNGYRMGILCSEFMQLAYRAVGNKEVFEGVRRLIREGHSLADKM